MKHLTRLSALLIASVSLCTGCGSEPPAEPVVGETTAAEETTVKDPEPILPDVDYTGKTLTILYRYDAHAYNVTDIWVQELNGDVINDAVFNRNLALEAKFGATLEPRPDVSPITTAKKEILADSVEFDLCGDRMFEMFPACTEGYFYDWNQLNYISFDEPWWDANAARDLSIGDQLPMMIGDFSLSASNGAYFMYFNKELMNRYGIEAPYAIAADGKWTFDKMLEMIRMSSQDLNGDGSYDIDDQYGFLWQVPYRLLSGFGLDLTMRDKDGYPYLAPLDDRFVEGFDKVADLLSDAVNTISYASASSGKDTSGYPNLYAFVRSYFTTDHFLFLEGSASVAKEFSNMKSSYGILPMPKMDESQENYYHLVDEYSVGWSIPANAADIEKTDILLEYFTYLSHEPLVNAYYDVTLKYKRLESEEDVEMLDLIFATKKYDITYIAGAGVREMLEEAVRNKTIASTYEANRSMIEAKLEKLHKAE